MGKKSSVASNNIKKKVRREGDFYPTPLKAVEPLLQHINHPWLVDYCEPCAGDGSLVKHLADLTENRVFCKLALDVSPKASWVTQRSALSLTKEDLDKAECDLIITNPPFSWDILQQLLEHLPTLRPTWLLLPFSYACNKRMAKYMRMCEKVQPIGRVKWIEDSAQSSTDDFAWFLFDSENTQTTKLYPRAEN